MKNIIKELYVTLRKKYGYPKGQWVLWCKRPKTIEEREEVVIGAILTQRTNWKNVELSIANLKSAGLNSLNSIYQLSKEKIIPLIKPSGFYFTKADYLFRLIEFILKEYGGIDKMMKAKTEDLRNQLLKLKGIGQETADSILLYALDKPVFVIDEYTRRMIKSYNISNDLSYEFLQKIFEENLKKDFRLYQDFHALIVIDGKGGY